MPAPALLDQSTEGFDRGIWRERSVPSSQVFRFIPLLSNISPSLDHSVMLWCTWAKWLPV